MTYSYNILNVSRASEGTQNLLSVDVTLGKGISRAREIMLSVFSERYKMFDAAYPTEDDVRRKRKLHFEISLPDKADLGDCIFVIYNGEPKLCGRAALGRNIPVRFSVAMEELRTESDEFFILNTLYFHDSWDTLNDLRLDANDTEAVVRLMNTVSRRRADSDWGHVSPILIHGDAKLARWVATDVIGLFFAGNRYTAICHTSLKELRHDQDGWTKLANDAEEAEVVDVEMDMMTRDEELRDIVTRLAFIATSKHQRRKVFIFHGDNRHVESAMQSVGVFQDSLASGFIIPLTTKRNKTEEEIDDELEDIMQMFADDDDEETQPETAAQTAGRGDCAAEDECPEEGEETETATAEGLSATEEKAAEEPSAAEQLQRMVGLETVKKEVSEAWMMASFHQSRRTLGLETRCENRNHMLFFGNPGTGKTTVAKLIGKMYKEMGILSKGHTVETNRTKLVGDVIGATEANMREAFDTARGGVLFIDEAYTLYTDSDDDGKDFGRQVLNALLTELSNPDPDMIIILAGYEDKMQRLLEFNEGLFDRFPVKLHFDDFSSEELCQMAVDMLHADNYSLSDGALSLMRQHISDTVRLRDRHFGNGRWVHNLVNQGIIKAMARRVMSNLPAAQNLQTFAVVEQCDIEETVRQAAGDRRTLKTEPRRIGFTA